MIENSYIFKPSGVDTQERSLQIIKYMKEKDDPFLKYIFRYGMSMDNIERELLLRYHKSKGPTWHKIDEIPIMITELGEIVCIPKFHELKSIAVYGSVGSGKTLLAHNLIDWSYHKFDYDVCILNDYKFKNWCWVYPNSSNHFVAQLKSLNINNISLPLVPIFPNVKTTKEFQRKIPNLKVKIPYKIFIRDIRLFFLLGESEKWFSMIKDDLLKCKSEKDLTDLKNKLIKEEFNKNSAGKIFGVILEYVKEGFISFDPEVIGEIKTEYDGKIDSALSQLIRARLIPSIVTKDLYLNKHAPNLIDYFVNDLINHINDDTHFKNKSLVFYVDELNQLLDLDKKREGIFNSLVRIARTGREVGYSLYFCAQNMSRVPREIATQCSFNFVFNTNDSDDVTELRKNFNLTKTEADQMKELQTLECMGFTKRDYFIVYDVLGNRRYTTKSVKGIIIPPLSHNLKPESSEKINPIKDFHEAFACDYVKRCLKKNKVKLINPETEEVIFNTNVTKFPNYNFDGAYILENFNYTKYFHHISETNWRIKSIFEYPDLRRRKLVIVNRPVHFYEEESLTKDGMIYAIEHEDKLSRDAVILSSIPKQIKQIKYIPVEREFTLVGEKCSPIPFKLI